MSDGGRHGDRAGGLHGGVRGLLFRPGAALTRTVIVALVDDAQAEDPEAFTVALRDPKHAALTGGAEILSATGAIQDDDGRDVLVSPTALAVAEGETGGHAVALTCSRPRR